MPIKKYIPGSYFDPGTIARMITAFENVRAILNISDANDPLVGTVAKKILSLASQGVTDPDEITRRVVADTEGR
jgi:hypothetical protein